MAFKEKKDEEKPEEAKKAKEEPKPKKPVSHVKDFEEDMVYLFQFTRSPQVGAQLNLDTPEAAANLTPSSLQIPSISPFCLKLESWLKLHGIKYQVGGLQ